MTSASNMINVSQLAVNPVSFLRLCSCLKSGDRRKSSAEWLQNSPAPHTYYGDFTQRGLGGVVSLSLSHAHHVSMATALTGTTTGSSCYQKRKCMWSFQCRDVTQSWSLCSVCLWFMALRLKFPVAALQSKVNFKHVLSQTQSCRGRRGKNRRGGKRWESSSGDKSLLCGRP